VVDFGKLMQLGRTGVEGFMDAEPPLSLFSKKYSAALARFKSIGK